MAISMACQRKAYLAANVAAIVILGRLSGLKAVNGASARHQRKRRMWRLTPMAMAAWHGVSAAQRHGVAAWRVIWRAIFGGEMASCQRNVGGGGIWRVAVAALAAKRRRIGYRRGVA